MPLPWKKNKVTRISQFVADLQSPQRGGSLVVETGFPTSLIDLFVKNRSRFKKRKSKKRLPLEISDPPPSATPPAPPPSPPTPPNSTASLEVSAEPRRFVRETVSEGGRVSYSGRAICRVDDCDCGSEPSSSATPSKSSNFLQVSADTRYSDAPSLSRLVREPVHDDDEAVDSGRVLNRASGIYATIVLAAILKVFAVVVLISSVKKLAVGITASAFVLLFFECSGKHIVRCLNLKPCRNANEAFRSLAQTVSCSFWFHRIAFKRVKHCEASEQEAIVHEAALELFSASSSIEEITVVQAKSETDVHCELSSLNRDKKWVCLDMEDDSNKKVGEQSEISECMTKGKRCAKLKSKMMKVLVPKKLRGLKKEKKSKNREAESKSEASSTVEGDKSARFEIEEQENRKITPLVIQNKPECTKDGEADYGMTCSKEGRIDNAGSSGYIILILITLAGLLGGRILALLFTMAWYFMLKMVNTRGMSENLSPIKVSL